MAKNSKATSDTTKARLLTPEEAAPITHLESFGIMVPIDEVYEKQSTVEAWIGGTKIALVVKIDDGFHRGDSDVRKPRHARVTVSRITPR